MWQQLISGWRPAVEIFILAVGIYYALMFVRGTRGWPVVIGFGAVVLLTFVSTALGLEVLSHLLRTFFGFSVVVLLIIFQPEVRRLLAKVGNQRLFSMTQERQGIEVIVETVERLADVRIGALIAMQRSVNLEDAVESGVRVDCDATPEMLETIFFPNNAIHDGGVLVDGSRILKAACIFPLTHRQDLAKSMGTRHRAALGLSEETDAVVIVVSEETGSISYAYKGELKRGLTAEELRAFLTTIFINEKPSFNFRQWFRRKRHRPEGEPAAAILPPAEGKTPTP